MKLFDFDKLTATLTGYIETKIEILKIDVKEGLSVAITKLVVAVVMVILGFFVTLFTFMGIASLLNELLESSYLGYLLVAGLFLILLTIVLFSRDKLMTMVKEKMAEQNDNPED